MSEHSIMKANSRCVGKVPAFLTFTLNGVE